MSCDTLRENFGDHIDRRLPPAEAAEMDRHLASCAACRAEVDDLRRVVAAVAGLPRRAAPKGFQAGVMARIQAESAAPVAPKQGRVLSLERYRHAMAIAAGMAAVFLVYVGVILVGRQEEAPRQNRSIATQEFEPRKKDIAERSRSSEDRGPLETKKAGPAPEGAGWMDPARDKDAKLKSKDGLNKAQQDVDEAKAVKKPESAEPAIQRVRVFSQDIAVDSRQVQDILRESGYTFMETGANETLMVKVPARRATQLVAALQKIDSDFRVEQKQEVREEADKLREATRRQQHGDREDGLVAQADDLEKALRQLEEMASESDRRKASKEAQGDSAPAAAAGEGGGRLPGGESSGKKDLDGATNDDGKNNGQEFGAAGGGSEKPRPKEPMKTAGGMAPGSEEPAAPRGAEPPADRAGAKADAGQSLGGEKRGLRDESLAHGDSEEEGAAGPADDAQESPEQEANREDAIRDLLEKLKKEEGGGDDVFLVIEFEKAKDSKPAVK